MVRKREQAPRTPNASRGLGCGFAPLRLCVTAPFRPRAGLAAVGRHAGAKHVSAPPPICRTISPKGTQATSSSRARRTRWIARTWRTSSGWPSSARKATATSPCPRAGSSSAPTTRTRATRGTSGDRSILMCFDEKTGELLWQLVVPKLASGKVNDWESLGLLSSPDDRGRPGLRGDQPLRGAVPRHAKGWRMATTARSRTRPSTWSKT